MNKAGLKAVGGYAVSAFITFAVLMGIFLTVLYVFGEWATVALWVIAGVIFMVTSISTYRSAKAADEIRLFANDEEIEAFARKIRPDLFDKQN